jgi:hypothetical protein
MWKTNPKEKHMHKKHGHYTSSYVKHVCNSGTTQWNLRKKGKEKKIIEHQQ